MYAIFQKKGKKNVKKWTKMGKIFENLGKNVQNLKILWKSADGLCVGKALKTLILLPNKKMKGSNINFKQKLF